MFLTGMLCYIMKIKLKKVGAHLQFTKIQKGIKQDEVARQLNVTTSYVSKIENGKTNLYLMTFIKYCMILQLSYIEVLKDLDVFKELL